MNSILAIHPYKSNGLWVIDDEKAGLVQEPFVSGADVIIERMVQDIPGAAEGFTLLFSASPFPDYQTVLEWRWEAIARSYKLLLVDWLAGALVGTSSSDAVLEWARRHRAD